VTARERVSGRFRLLRRDRELGRKAGTIDVMSPRERVTVELDPDVASLLRERAAEADVTEGEIVERALRASDLRELVAQIRGRSDLDEGAAMALAREELKAARAEARNRAA
jgi:hypothetical protein